MSKPASGFLVQTEFLYTVLEYDVTIIELALFLLKEELFGEYSPYF